MHRPSVQILLLLLTLFIMMVGFGIVIPTLPFLARRVNASPVQMGLLVTVWAAAQFLTAPLWGDVSDRVGRKPVLLAGVLGFGLTFFLMALARSYLALLLARLAGGLLSSAALPTSQAMVADLTEPERRGAAMGAIGGVFSLGFMFGPAIGGALAPLGLAVPFVVAGALGTIAAPVGFLLLREPPPRTPRVRQPLWRGVWAALRSPYSILFWLAFGATFGGSAMFSMLGYYFIDRLAGSPTQVGLAFTLLGLAGVALQFGLVGPLIRRWGEVAVTCAGLLVGAIGFAVTAASATATVVIACVVLIGIGLALVRPAITSLLSKRAEQGLGLAMGVQSAFDSLGRTVGPLWAGMIYAVDIRAPFASSSAVFLLFFLATLGAARRVRPAPQTAGR